MVGTEKRNFLVREVGKEILIVIFVIKKKTVCYSFVSCSITKCLCWIANYNNLHFNVSTIEQLWDLDHLIPLKWILWLERNRLIFMGGKCKTEKHGDVYYKFS